LHRIDGLWDPHDIIMRCYWCWCCGAPFVGHNFPWVCFLAAKTSWSSILWADVIVARCCISIKIHLSGIAIEMIFSMIIPRSSQVSSIAFPNLNRKFFFHVLTIVGVDGFSECRFLSFALLQSFVLHCAHHSEHVFFFPRQKSFFFPRHKGENLVGYSVIEVDAASASK
jgi:hypothetical protein